MAQAPVLVHVEEIERRLSILERRIASLERFVADQSRVGAARRPLLQEA